MSAPRDSSYKPRREGLSPPTSPTTGNTHPDQQTKMRPVTTASTINNVLSQVLPPWEIHKKTHLPLHLEGCNECLSFTRHFAQNNQGSTFVLLFEKMRHHWENVLDDDFQCAYQDRCRKADIKRWELEDHLEEYKQCMQDLKDEVEVLKKQLSEQKEGTSKHPSTYSPSPSHSARGGGRADKKRRFSPPRVTPSPSPQPKVPMPDRKGKGRAMYESDSSSGELTPPRSETDEEAEALHNKLLVEAIRWS